MKLLRAIFWSMVAVFLGIWLFSTRACAQDAAPSYKREAPHILPYFTVLPDAPIPSRPKHRNWFYRHPVWVGLIAGGTFGGVWALTHREGCPHTVSGFPYDGNGRPCPTYCEAQGDCYWPPK